jgi:hypothetical protein
MFWEKEQSDCKFCGKVTYLTVGDVEFAAKDNLGYYECPYKKGQYHLTSKMDKYGRKKTRKNNR